MVQDKDLKAGQPRLLTVDNELVVPVNKVVHVLTTGADVIHAFAVPAFGIKIDAIPGRINETWFKAEREGGLLRTMLRAVRQGSRVHADRGPGAHRKRLCGMARAGEKEIRNRRQSSNRGGCGRRCKLRHAGDNDEVEGQ
jgi:Cytochrome C oxidase subunit II, periplasmic domain